MTDTVYSVLTRKEMQDRYEPLAHKIVREMLPVLKNLAKNKCIVLEGQDRRIVTNLRERFNYLKYIGKSDIRVSVKTVLNEAENTVDIILSVIH